VAWHRTYLPAQKMKLEFIGQCDNTGGQNNQGPKEKHGNYK